MKEEPRRAIPKRHHFIPILHLKHFAGDDPKGQVWTYDATTGDVRSAVPDETAVEGHFYSAQRIDGTMDTRLEEHLAKMESAAAPVYEALLRCEMPKASQTRADFATFLALMYVRTPAMRRMAAEVHGKGIQTLLYTNASNRQIFESSMKRFEKERGEPIDAAMKESIRQDMLDPSGYVIEIPKESTFSALSVADTLAPLFLEMKWSLIVAEHGYFITSDNPVVRSVDPITRHPVMGDHGFYNKTAEVSVSLSPKMLLVMSWNKDALELGVLERDHVHHTNRILAAHSERYLYAHIRDRRLARLATEFKDSRPGMTTLGPGPKKFAAIKVSRRRRTDQTA
jgi:hypothetical protein